MNTLRKCGKCALWLHNGGICPIFQRELPQDTEGCPEFTTDINECMNCGQGYVGKGVVVYDSPEDTQYSVLCSKCGSQVGKCPTCKYGNECAFESDPLPIPKMVQKQIRQGNMTAVTTVPNPERIAKTCKEKCRCFNETGCLKQNGFCDNFEGGYAKV